MKTSLKDLEDNYKAKIIKNIKMQTISPENIKGHIYLGKEIKNNFN